MEDKEITELRTRLHRLWLASGIWRKHSFEDFLKETIEIIKRNK